MYENLYIFANVIDIIVVEQNLHGNAWTYYIWDSSVYKRFHPTVFCGIWLLIYILNAVMASITVTS